VASALGTPIYANRNGLPELPIEAPEKRGSKYWYSAYREVLSATWPPARKNGASRNRTFNISMRFGQEFHSQAAGHQHRQAP
jgi:hypothetical protein